MGAPNLLADNMEYGLSYSVVSYLKKLSQQVWFTCLYLGTGSGISLLLFVLFLFQLRRVFPVEIKIPQSGLREAKIKYFHVGNKPNIIKLLFCLTLLVKNRV